MRTYIFLNTTTINTKDVYWFMRINMWGSVCTLSIKSFKSLSIADSFDYDQRLKQ